jgi:hypothetical protein
MPSFHHDPLFGKNAKTYEDGCPGTEHSYQLDLISGIQKDEVHIEQTTVSTIKAARSG